MSPIELAGRALLFLVGAGLVVGTVQSAIKTFVLPRAAPSLLATAVFRAVRLVFKLRLARAVTYQERDRVMALYAPVGLLALSAAWLVLVDLGYTAMFRAVGVDSWPAALTLSGSSLLTLGFANPANLVQVLLSFSEASIGLGLVALLIAYLPTMYAAFSRREAAVTMLETRAGSPPSPVELLARYRRIGALGRLGELWTQWEQWFVDLGETHTSLAALSFFRSPRPEHSWVTAAGAVLDTGALVYSSVDLPDDPQLAITLRAGYLALRHIAEYYDLEYDPDPKPDDPISVTRHEFDQVCDRLVENGLQLKPDREAAWRSFVGWRVNYDTVLLALAALTMAPLAPWSSDRSKLVRRPFIRRLRREP
ncbi:MAG TPA: hypothetical protein VG370_07420 [Chloroflexota bacterium]|nr:hypothetical protein [Chloroflexota bacterium]